MKESTSFGIIRMFGKTLASPDGLLDFKKVNEVAMPLGYIVHPDACTKTTLAFVRNERLNPNSTFYKSFEDVKSKNRLELFFDQVMHYFTTYGSSFALGNGYVPNDCDFVPYTTYKYILPASRTELFDDCIGLLETGIALKRSTIDVIVDYIRSQGLLKDVNLDKIKNKEAQCILSIAKGVLPNDEFGMLRTLVYATTGSAMIIKSKEQISAINASAVKANILFETISGEQEKKLSRIFLRYKPIFLSLKNENTKSSINRIRKLAVKNHTPLKVGFWESILNPESQEHVFEELPEQLRKVSNYKKLQVLGGIRVRVNSSASNGRFFVVRNGKMFVREGYHSPTDVEYLMQLYKMIEESIVEDLRAKATTYKVREGVNITAPTSEKSFVGNYPLGTSVDVGNEGIVGVYWRNKWGVRDYDLHLVGSNGRQFGWCHDYHDEEFGVTFSGDMTNAEPEAAECYSIKGDVRAYVNLNIFSMLPGFTGQPKVRLFFASNTQDNVDRIDKCWKAGWGTKRTAPMVDPDTIKFDAYLEFDENAQRTLGYITDGKFYFLDKGSGNGSVTSAGNDSRNKVLQEQLRIQCESFVGIERLLELAGFQKVGEDDEAELDLTNPSKDALIKLFE